MTEGLERDISYEKFLQFSALSRLNFVFNDLKNNPPKIMRIDDDKGNPNPELIKYYKGLPSAEQQQFYKEFTAYLATESVNEAKFMLVFNYLYALLVNNKDNKISFYKTHPERRGELDKFKKENKKLIQNIEFIRKKVYAHIDPDWMNYVKNISFDEIQKCILFMDNLIGMKPECYEVPR